MSIVLDFFIKTTGTGDDESALGSNRLPILSDTILHHIIRIGLRARTRSAYLASPPITHNLWVAIM